MSSLNDVLCIARPTLTDLNPIEIKHYPFIVTLNKCIVLSPKICVSKKAKDINAKAFNKIANKSEGKTMNSIVHHVIQIINGITITTCQCKCKNYSKCKKDYSCTPST